MRNENCDRKSSCDDYKHNHCDGCGGNKPKGDLISREALKKALSKRLWFVSSPECDAQEIKEVIDNAPTVNPCENCDLYFKAMTKEEMKKGGAE